MRIDLSWRREGDEEEYEKLKLLDAEELAKLKVKDQKEIDALKNS